MAGTGTIPGTFGLTKALIPGQSDSIIGFHSAAGMSQVGAFTDACAVPKYNSHFVESGLCAGVADDHISIAPAYICRLGGC
jgi:hypothetical protein